MADMQRRVSAAKPKETSACPMCAEVFTRRSDMEVSHCTNFFSVTELINSDITGSTVSLDTV